MSEKIGITPGVGVFAVLRRLNYKPWYALAEYVDNSIDSYLKNKDALFAAHGPGYKLHVEIDISEDGSSIRVVDNAAGIRAADLERALRMAEPPPDKSRLSEFGMGMKAASCWFAPVWVVQTKALGEPLARSVTFNVDEIIEKQTSELEVKLAKKAANAHYTVIQINKLFTPLFKKAIGKIFDHLASMYRYYLRAGEVEISLNGVQMTADEPVILVAPAYNDPAAKPIKWYKQVQFTCSGGRAVDGFAALRDVGSYDKAGFALIRRGRVIEGSNVEGYRPKEIFGHGNSYRSSRLFGELHLDGFAVSHTKDGIQWEGCQDEFLDELRKALSDPKMPLLTQAEKLRTRNKPAPNPPPASEVAPAPGSDKPAPGASQPLGAKPSSSAQPPYSGGGVPNSKLGPLFAQPHIYTLKAILGGLSWLVTVQLCSNPIQTDWIEIGEHLQAKKLPPASVGMKQVGVRIALDHPLSQQLLSERGGQSEALARLGAAVALAKTRAQAGGATQTGLIIDYLNELLDEDVLLPV